MESSEKGCAVIDTKDLPPYVEKVNNDAAVREGWRLPTRKWVILGVVLITVVAMVITGVVIGVYFQNEHTRALIKEFRKDTPLGEETIKTNVDDEEEEIDLPKQELRVLHDFKRGVTVMRMKMDGKFGCFLKVLHKDGKMDPETLESYLENGGIEAPVNTSGSENETGEYGMVASDSPIKDTDFLGDNILNMCEGLDITWLLPNDHEVEVREKRSTSSTELSRQKRALIVCYQVRYCWYEVRRSWFRRYFVRICVTLYRRCYIFG